MNNRCILEQLGYDINDERVTKSSDGYIDVKLADNLYVGADRDYSSITIHTYNKDILDIDLRTYDACSDIEFRIPNSLYCGQESNGHKDFEDYEIIVRMDLYGVDKSWRKQGEKEEELLFHMDKRKYSVDDVASIILSTIENNDKPIDGIDIKEAIKIIEKGINPLIKQQIEKINRLFDVKKSSPEEILSWMIACQQNDSYDEDGIISDKGLRLAEVPEVKEYKLKWEPSGLYNPNKWRNK